MSVAMPLDRRDVFSRATVAVCFLDQHRQDSFERARGPEGLSVRPERFPGWFNNNRHPAARPEDLCQHSAAADFLAGPENGGFPGSGPAKLSGRKLKSLKTNGASPAAAKRHSFAREARGRMGTDSLRPSGSLALHDESFLAFPPIGTWPGEGGSSRGHRGFFSAPDRRKGCKPHHRDTELLPWIQEISPGNQAEISVSLVYHVNISRSCENPVAGAVERPSCPSVRAMPVERQGNDTTKTQRSPAERTRNSLCLCGVIALLAAVRNGRQVMRRPANREPLRIFARTGYIPMGCRDGF